MSVIAADPELHLLPASIPLGIEADLVDGVVHDFHRVCHDRATLSLCVRSFVDSGEGDECVAISSGTQPVGRFFTDAAIDCQPTADVAAEMGGGRTRDECRTLANSVPPPQSPCDDTQRAEARLRQLEYRRRCWIDVAIHEPHLR